MLRFKDAPNTARLNILSDAVFKKFNFLPMVVNIPSPPALASMSAFLKNNLRDSFGKDSENTFFIKSPSYGLNINLATS